MINTLDLHKITPLITTSRFNTENVIVVSCKNLLFTVTCLKKHINYQYKLLTCVSGVDFLYSKYRFSVVYDFLSLKFNARLRLKINVNESTPVVSIVSICKNSNWWEREVWDLYGIYFTKHPDLRRILTDYGYEGFPMRKDYPLSGYIELRYDFNKKRVVINPIELAQDFRYFSFATNWQITL